MTAVRLRAVEALCGWAFHFFKGGKAVLLTDFYGLRKADFWRSAVFALPLRCLFRDRQRALWLDYINWLYKRNALRLKSFKDLCATGQMKCQRRYHQSFCNGTLDDETLRYAGILQLAAAHLKHRPFQTRTGCCVTARQPVCNFFV